MSKLASIDVARVERFGRLLWNTLEDMSTIPPTSRCGLAGQVWSPSRHLAGSLECRSKLASWDSALSIT